tara:strand:- start:6556 stop:6969 length:414 start_codon:yes stop_codon:yes gene_type:complete
MEDFKIALDFSDRLETAMSRAGYRKGARKPEKNLSDFARDVEIHSTAVLHYLKGSYVPQPDVLERIAITCGVDVSYFLSSVGAKQIKRTSTSKGARHGKVSKDSNWLLLETETKQMSYVEVLSIDKANGIMVIKTKD